ncbi:phosphoribosyl-AMP cyclohydrolase [Acetobacter persici]|uniref:Histidine biosynthesis bifunctional protein HisIE n=2 Tax=Acetobacter TaxID=434 RepID=A0A252A9A2_9PROT|nr:MULTISPECIES: phosphoribosyl-AMP cyclohydrolase [Acetobacter]AQT03875.1 phosphoribosyl-AMP cyclohydrolase [Acetobacter persici]MBS1002128.1 phosphoribosyl-AMP cyclohydrolase [Acetobacter persici]OUI86159.1 phosphoribosyl-AMP cyclohydrolase [Acetobacter tropicalis]
MMGETLPSEPTEFRPRVSIEQVEEGTDLAPRFDARGLLTVVTTDAESGDVMMVGVMNAEALARTIETREAHYWSRSRQCLWRKGATSGLIQHVIEMRIDDDQDAVWLRVHTAGTGANCHVGYRSCFYRRVDLPADEVVSASSAELVFCETHKTFDPVVVYGDVPNPTQL